MKAALVREYGAPVSIEEIQVDSPGPREVLIRTAAAGVCHSDYSVRAGILSMTPLPLVLGHESAGVVEAVGSQVEYVAPGDHVITCLSMFCGHCKFCLQGRPALCDRVGLLRPEGAKPRLSQDGTGLSQMAGLGSFAEQLLVHESSVVKITKEMPLDRAAVIGCGVTTGFGAVINTAKVPAMATVAVIGCGGVGLAAVQGARIAGARTIIAVDRFPSRLERARTLGATHVVNPEDGDPVEQVREISGGGVEYSFECVGLSATATQAFDMVEKGGTATIVGVVIGQKIEVDGTLLQSERKLQGSSMGSNRFRIDMPRMVDLYLQGRLLLDDIVTDRLPLDGLNGAFDAMERGEGARSVIVFE
jgi:S-(hydroxymethyl)glutathione dehydrogenase/alcohol dehydrogenase